MLNLTEGSESTLKHCLHYRGPALLAPNSQLNKYGYERRFIDKSWWIQPRRRKLAMKYCYSKRPWCPIVEDVMKWFVLPKQVCSLITLLMLSLLPGFVFGLLPPGNTQPAFREKNESDHLQQGDVSAESQNKFGILLRRLLRSHAFASHISGKGQLM